MIYLKGGIGFGLAFIIASTLISIPWQCVCFNLTLDQNTFQSCMRFILIYLYTSKHLNFSFTRRRITVQIYIPWFSFGNHVKLKFVLKLNKL